MKKRVLIAFALAGAITLTACGKETVYIVTDATEAPAENTPDTTEKATTTTVAKSNRPPASNYQPPANDYDPEAYDTFLWENVNEFWWLFTKEELLTMGLLVCEEFDRGQTLDQVTESVLNALSNTNTLYLMDGLAAVTGAAVTFLCPEHAWWMDTL